MELNPVQNFLTRQGSERDVAAHFKVTDLIKTPLTPQQLRAITASSWLCQKVVAYIPKEMVSVEFGVSLTGETGKARTIRDLTIIQEQLRRLMPWFGEAQRRANIVGKSYLVLNVSSVLPIVAEIEEIETPEEALEPPQDDLLDSVESQIDMTYGNGRYARGSDPNDPQFQTVPLIGQQRPELLQQQEETVDDVALQRLIERFPYSFPVQWEELKDVQVSGVEIVDGDRYTYTKNGRFLYRKASGLNKSHLAKDINVRSTLQKWHDDDPEGTSNILEIIHEGNVIEFTAFDYQEEYINKKDATAGNEMNLEKGTGDGKKLSQSFRLTRFISSLLYYDSFVNAVLNRAHRAEFIVYKKENLGDTNLEIARAAANQAQSVNGAPPVVVDAQLAIREELTTIANSALNHGVVLVDKTSEIDLLARSFTGIQNVHDVFRPIVIGSSGLTEFTLFGLVMTSAGLNGQDVRDRMAISGQVDILFRDSWQPMLEKLGNYIALSYKTFPSNAYLSIKPSSSFRLTELEISDVLEKLIDTRLELVKWGVISREELRTELKGDGLLGKYFSITKPDADTIAEIAKNDELLVSSMYMQSTMSNTAYTQDATDTSVPVVVTSTTNKDSFPIKIKPNIRTRRKTN